MRCNRAIEANIRFIHKHRVRSVHWVLAHSFVCMPIHLNSAFVYERDNALSMAIHSFTSTVYAQYTGYLFIPFGCCLTLHDYSRIN